MKKKLSQTAQILLLKRLRRMCPFAVFSGFYGYTCGGMVGGGTFFFRHGRSLKGSSPLYALMRRLAKASIHKWLRHNDFKTYNQCVWLKH